MSAKNKFKAQLDVAKAQLAEKQQELDARKQQDVERAESYLCINRLWEQLNDRLQHLATRLDVQIIQKELGDADVTVVATAAQAISDPYLTRLLLGDPASFKAVKKAHSSLQQGLSDAERELSERSTATTDAFARVLEVVQQQTRYSSSLATQIASSAADATLKQENQRLAADLVRLQQQLDGSHAKALSASQLLKGRENQLTVVQQQYKQADADLADKNSQYDLLRCKLQELQQKVTKAEAEAAIAKAEAAAANAAAAKPVLINPSNAQATDPGAAAAGPSSTAAAPPADPAAVAPDVQEQLADLQRLCDQRAAALEAERLEHVKTKQ
jgi:chromosome segregation ATPase